MHGKTKGHSDYIDSLVDRLKPEYELIATNVEYRDRNCNVIGELDLICKKGSRFDIIEVKCNDGSRQKAMDQLYRAYDRLNSDGIELRLYYYCGHDGMLKRVL
jgi:hypothetical protein